MPTSDSNHVGELGTPERNRFFYGKLMDVDQFEKDQRYFNNKRTLINRLVLGRGVVCGLDVVANPENENRVLVQPGLAIDGSGFEIVVPGDGGVLSIDPRQLTNAQGEAEGEPLDSGTVEICLAYAEVETDLAPVLVTECYGNGNCAPNTIREGFQIIVRLAEEAPGPHPACQFEDFPLSGNADLHALLCGRISGPCPPVPDDPCVPIARVSLPLTADSIDTCIARPLVYNHGLLYEMFLCLSAEVQALRLGPFLRIVSGNNQSGAPDALLPEPLVVELMSPEGSPVSGEIVQFQVTAGSGSVNPPTIQTDPQGQAETQWTLGSLDEQQTVIVKAMGTVFTVTFQAEAVE